MSQNAKDSNAPNRDVLRKTREDFDFIKEIGEGSFSTVYLAKDKGSEHLFAIKECNKAQIVKENKVKYVHLEKKILAEHLNSHPFFVKLCFTFQDEENLYFGLSYCPNGDLLDHIKKSQGFSLHRARFYSAELTDALEYMHAKQIVHSPHLRDLKPENILLDEKFHIKLTDFGTARILTDSEETSGQSANANSNKSDQDSKHHRRKNSFVGTAQFVAPEILQGKKPTTSCDLWSFGCIIFQMLTNKHLFTGGHEYDIFQKIVRTEFSLPDDFDSTCGDLIKKLIVSDPSKRLGAQGYDKLKAHLFFESITWSNLWEQEPPE